MLEQFKSMYRIQSLDEKIENHLKIIEEENSRVAHIEKLRERNMTEKDQLIAELEQSKTQSKAMEKELYQIEEKIKKNKEHANQVTNAAQANAIEKEIEVLEPKRDQIENDSFELLEKIEEIEGKISKREGFLEGSISTLEDLKKEVNATVTDEQKKIELLNKEIASFLSVIEGHTKIVFEKVREKYRFKKPLATIDNQGHCQMCKMGIDSVTKQEVEESRSVVTCSGCRRILLPLTVTL